MKVSRWLVPVLTSGGLCFSGSARGDLQNDVARLTRAVITHKPRHLGPRILEQADELPLLLPQPLTPKRASDCVHVVALAAQGVQFMLSVPAANEDTDDVALSSRAGMIEFVHCGLPDASFGDLSLIMLSTRGIVDIVGYVNHSPQPEALRFLPWRAAGQEAAELNLEHRVAFGSIDERLQRLEQHAMFNAADRTEQKPIPNQDLESGELLVGFDPGCHEVQLVIELSRPLGPAGDLEPELVWTDNGEPARSSLSNSPSSTFRICTAAARVARLSFNPNAAYAKAVLFRAHYLWPRGIPSNWSMQARDQMALTLFWRHLPSLATLPAMSWVGSSSPTSVVMPVAANSCYLAVVATSHGNQNDIALSVSSDSRWASASSLYDMGASVAFCVGRTTSVSLAVDARGSDVVWILGVWSIARGPMYSDFS